MMDGTLWRARIETPARDDLSLESEISWPESLRPAPEYAFFENPEKGVFVCEVFLKKKPSRRELDVISETLSQTLGISGLKPEFEEIAEDDWVRVSLDYLSPVEAGGFFIHGSHDRDKIPAGLTPILIDASLAFGTGHHETTRGCLRALKGLADHFGPEGVLDLGTGSGILAIAAAKIWPRAKICASDKDPKAIEKAGEFARANQAGSIAFILAEGFEDPAFKGKTFDLIIANILARPLIDLAEKIETRLKKGGRLVLSGILSRQKAEVLKPYRSLGLRLLEETEENGWPTLVLEKP